MLVSPKAKQATNLILRCIIAGVCIWCSWAIARVFSSRAGVAVSQAEAPAHKKFSSPSSGAGLVSHDAGPVLFDDPNDIRYWPSIPELQWFARTKPDGLFRKQSQDDYEARRWVWYGNQNALILWPEDPK